MDFIKAKHAEHNSTMSGVGKLKTGARLATNKSIDIGDYTQMNSAKRSVNTSHQNLSVSDLSKMINSKLVI